MFSFRSLCHPEAHALFFFENLEKKIESDDEQHYTQKLQVWEWDMMPHCIREISGTDKHQNYREKYPESPA
jgi:hypothetical protein